jgi:hypothetical protein
MILNISKDRKLIIHYLASIAYHFQKVIRNAPNDYWEFTIGNKVRTPKEILLHMTSLIGYARTFLIGGTYTPEALPAIPDEIDRFHNILKDVSEHLNSDVKLKNINEYQLLQGPLSDIMTHIGQLSMLRRLYGDPVPPENFIYADISSGKLGKDQSLPNAPDKDWPEGPSAGKT